MWKVLMNDKVIAVRETKQDAYAAMFRQMEINTRTGNYGNNKWKVKWCPV